MSGRNVVIVESPAKAKTINKYLGPDYTVVASLGHIRDLPSKDGSVRPEEDFEMDWEFSEKAKRNVDAIVDAVKDAERVYLATDPDREGEAISWHVQEVLEQKKLLKDREVRRVTFNEITKSAVQDAFENARDLDTALIEAYLARRALDYLVGFTLSPVLWRKLPGSRSAGRVQSVALRLICEREAEIEVFKPQEYWSVEARLKTDGGETVPSRLTHLNGKKLDKFALGNEAAAQEAVAAIKAGSFAVTSVERKQVKRNPYPPFITSTLQMDASRQLGFGATKTMRVAQQLYEGVDIGGETVGLITYMRTDGVNLSQEAIDASRAVIAEDYGDRYVPDKPRLYKSKQKNAQEAHEAIRPTDLTRRPDQLKRYLDADQARLYSLIWKRTIACEMESAVFDQVAIDIAPADGKTVLRATGSVVKFDGFLKVYEEGRDDTDDEENAEKRLPTLSEGQKLGLDSVTPNQHFTQPPPRYSEASLVKKLEELGIGRPSTYASIMQVLQDRDYVTLEKKRFKPQSRGRVVTAFLTNFFERYVRYDFTAQLEEQLDDISGRRTSWKAVLRDFWVSFSAAVEETKGLSIKEIIDALDRELGPYLFPITDENPDPRACPSCEDGRLGLRLGKSGPFIGCSNYPGCKYTRSLDGNSGEDSGGGERFLGNDPESGLPVYVKRGPYGEYAQLGPPPEDETPAAEGGKKKKAPKPKRVSVPAPYDPWTLDLDTALKLLSLPREIGKHPDTGESIEAGIGRYGPYLKHAGVYVSVPKDEDVLSVGMNRAVDLIAEKGKKATGPLRTLGEHPEDGEAVTLNRGRYGPYVKHGKLMASLRKQHDVDSMTLEEAIELLNAKAEGGGKATNNAGKGKNAAAKAEGGTKKAATTKKTANAAAKSTGGANKTAKAKSGSKTTGTKKTAAKTRSKAASGATRGSGA